MNIKIGSVLLFALSVYFIMNVRISPGETPYWLFGLIFSGLIAYLVLDIIKVSSNFYNRAKNILLWIIIIIIIGSSFGSEIIVRHQTDPTYNVHDIILQQESAIRFLIHGKNPYSTSYFGTPLEKWHYSDKEINPALYYFVMQPFYVIFAIPFYFISTRTIGYFDARMPLLFLFFLTLFLINKLIKNQEKKHLALILFAFNPVNIFYMLEGRSDIFMFAFLFLSFFLLFRKKYSFAGVALALAFAVKQSVWPILPFYFAYVYFKNKSFIKAFKLMIPFIATLAVVILPFFLWNQKAFLESTVFYLSGNIPHSYPISGYGLGMVLYKAGFIKNLQGFYPFYIWQILTGIPLMFILIKLLKKNQNVKFLIVIYGIFLFAFWYLSRYFNNSHLGYLSIVFLTSYLWPEEETK